MICDSETLLSTVRPSAPEQKNNGPSTLERFPHSGPQAWGYVTLNNTGMQLKAWSPSGEGDPGSTGQAPCRRSHETLHMKTLSQLGFQPWKEQKTGPRGQGSHLPASVLKMEEGGWAPKNEEKLEMALGSQPTRTQRPKSNIHKEVNSGNKTKEQRNRFSSRAYREEHHQRHLNVSLVRPAPNV